MEIYDTEEEQVAALKRWWKENGTSMIATVIVSFAILAGWNLWKNHKAGQASQASAMYEQLLASKNAESAVEISKQIMQRYSSTAYATYSALILAKTKVDQGDLEEAKTILGKQMSVANSVEFKNLARVRLIKLLLATDENEKGLQLIAEADQTSIDGFSATYDELKGDLYVALDRLGEARTAYQGAVREGSRSPLLQMKLDDITASDIIE